MLRKISFILLVVAFLFVNLASALQLNALKTVTWLPTGHSSATYGLLLSSFILFWLSFRFWLSTHPQLVRNSVTLKPPRYLTFLAMLVLLGQILLGVWVNINNAGLVCSDLPLCKPQLLQQADYESGLNLLNIEHLSFNAKVAVHWLHRLGGLASFVVLSLLMLSATSEQYAKAIRRSGLALSMLLLVQIMLGIYTIKLGALAWLDVAHSVMAAVLMLPLIAISFYSKHGFVEAEQAVEVAESGIKVTKQPVSEGVDPSYARLKSQLGKTRSGLGGILAALPFGKKAINEDLLEEIEANLLLADIGIEATTEIIDKLTDNLDHQQLNNGDALFAALKQDLLDMLIPVSKPLQIPKQDSPFVILVVGVNGVGKTTTIGKLAKKLQNQGHSVMLAAGDTFRAAAVEQLQVWGQRNDIHVVAQHTGADSASVIFDAFQSAKAKGIDVLIADTAGRLHTKSHLMEELKKIKRIISKVDESAPHEVLLVLDAGTGQNALSQAKLFNEAVPLTGLALTKLDGTAKGGIIFALAKQLGVAIRYIGVGEGIDDLQDFNAQNFVDALFVKDE